ncbi:MAG: hypothetical protein KF770_18685 [Anaerolineae bacterium]|nr:hypothetical protein [Anaerolineae bacterium]
MAEYQITYKERLYQEIEATPGEYLPALLNIVRVYRESVTLKPAVDSFYQGWQEAMHNETFSINELWDGIDAE